MSSMINSLWMVNLVRTTQMQWRVFAGVGVLIFPSNGVVDIAQGRVFVDILRPLRSKCQDSCVCVHGSFAESLLCQVSRANLVAHLGPCTVGSIRNASRAKQHGETAKSPGYARGKRNLLTHFMVTSQKLTVRAPKDTNPIESQWYGGFQAPVSVFTSDQLMICFDICAFSRAIRLWCLWKWSHHGSYHSSIPTFDQIHRSRGKLDHKLSLSWVHPTWFQLFFQLLE